MSKPMHADRWYETPNVDELRQEFQNAYQVIDSAIDGVNIANYYTKTETNNLLDAFYTSAEVDALVTPSAILTKLLTVDGPSSGLNADLLDGYDHTDFAKLTGATFTGDVIFNAGPAAVTLSGGSYPDVRWESSLNSDVYGLFAGATNLTFRNFTSGVNIVDVLMNSGSEDLKVNGQIVADYGSNANGEYVRFYNGMQVCWKRKTTVASGVGSGSYSYTWTFPAAFANGNEVWVGGTLHEHVWFGGVRYLFDQVGAFAIGTTQAWIGTVYSGDVVIDIRTTLVAIGRWY